MSCSYPWRGTWSWWKDPNGKCGAWRRVCEELAAWPCHESFNIIHVPSNMTFADRFLHMERICSDIKRLPEGLHLYWFCNHISINVCVQNTIDFESIKEKGEVYLRLMTAHGIFILLGMQLLEYFSLGGGAGKQHEGRQRKWFGVEDMSL